MSRKVRSVGKATHRRNGNTLNGGHAQSVLLCILGTIRFLFERLRCALLSISRLLGIRDIVPLSDCKRFVCSSLMYKKFALASLRVEPRLTRLGKKQGRKLPNQSLLGSMSSQFSPARLL